MAHVLSSLADDASNGGFGHHHLGTQVYLILLGQSHLRFHFLKDVELGLEKEKLFVKTQTTT